LATPSLTAREIDPKLQVDCMGSYRRGADSSGDIDLLVTRDPSDGKTHEGAHLLFLVVLPPLLT